MRDKIEDKIISVIYELKGDVAEMEIDENTDLFKDLDFDSIEVMAFITELEVLFKIQFEDVDELMDVMCNVKSVAEFVYNCLHINEG